MAIPYRPPGFDVQFQLASTPAPPAPVSRTAALIGPGNATLNVRESLVVRSDNRVGAITITSAPGQLDGEAGNVYTAQPQLSTSGSGTGATFTITRDAFGVVVTVAVVADGDGYDVGDTITIAGANVGGVTPVNNVVLTVSQVNVNNATVATAALNTIVGRSGVYTGVAGTGVGAGATFNITRTLAGQVTTPNVTVATAGTGWDVGDVVTVLGSAVGSTEAPPNDNVTLTVSANDIVGFGAPSVNILEAGAVYVALATTGAGNDNATFNSSRNAAGVFQAPVVNAAGTGYSINDNPVIAGTNFGPSGVSPADDVTLDVTATDIVGTVITASTAIPAEANNVYPGVATTGGGGTGATFTVTRDGLGAVLSVVSDDTDDGGYSSGDSLTILGADVGGATPADNIVITLDCGVLTAVIVGVPSIIGTGDTYGPVAVVGTGAGATFNFSRHATTGQLQIVAIVAPGDGYADGETVTVLGANIGGVTPAANATFTVTTGIEAVTVTTATILEASESYPGIGQLSTSGSGAGAVFTITRNAAGEAVTATVTNGGAGYADGDTIVIAGANIGGITPTDNITLTVASCGVNTTSITTAGPALDGEAGEVYLDRASTTSGAGLGATFDITRGTTIPNVGVVTTVVPNDLGTGYLPGDTITISGVLVGGTTPANDVTLLVTTVGSKDILTNEFTIVGTPAIRSLDGTILYTPVTDYSITTSGIYTLIEWSPVGPLTKEPAGGETYIVDYVRNKTNADYNALRLFSSLEGYAQFGSPHTLDAGATVTNELAAAVDIGFRAGAPEIIAVQINPADGTIAQQYAEALKKVEEDDNIYYIVVMNTDPLVRTEVLNHVSRMSVSEESKYRVAYVAAPSSTTVDGYVAMATSIRSQLLPDQTSVGERIRIVAPPSCVVDVAGPDNNSTFTSVVPGYFCSAALAARESSRSAAVTMTDAPVTGVRGLRFTNNTTNKYRKIDMNRLGGAGVTVLVIDDNTSTVTVRDARTADPTSVVSSDPSAVAVKDFTAYTVAKTLVTKYKNARASNSTLKAITTDLNGVLTSLTDPTNGVLLGYSDAAVQRDPQDPRRIIVSYKISPVLSIREISVRYGIDLGIGTGI